MTGEAHRALSDTLATRSVWRYLTDESERQRVTAIKRDNRNKAEAAGAWKTLEYREQQILLHIKDRVDTAIARWMGLPETAVFYHPWNWPNRISPDQKVWYQETWGIPPVRLNQKEQTAIEWLRDFADRLARGLPTERNGDHETAQLAKMGIQLNFVGHKKVDTLIRGKEGAFPWHLSTQKYSCTTKTYLPFQIKKLKTPKAKKQ